MELITDPSIVTGRRRNRALLARQGLLARSATPPLEMVERLVGLQAQNPQDPYLALWSRLDGFDPGGLSTALAERRIVRMGLLRTTLHLVTAEDAAAAWPVIRPVLERAWRSSPFRKDLAGVEVDDVVAAGRELLAEAPLTLTELGRRLAERWPDRRANSLGYAVRFLAPIVQVPPRGLWQQAGQPRWQPLDTWLGRPVPDEPAPADDLVLRYLAAFGPASAKDVATWSWLTGIRDVLDRLRPRLRVLRDERGAELLDVPDAPLPDPDTAVPVRFLPEYDNVFLSHADRSLIVAPEAYGRVTGFVGTFLVDGYIAGQWRIDRPKDAAVSATLVLEPFVTLTAADRDELVAEAEALLAFAAAGAGPGNVTFGVAREVPPPSRSSDGQPEKPSPSRGHWAPR